MPLFSIITITKNNRAGLACTANSVTTQTCTDYEWIIIDGESTDGTQADFPLYKPANLISEADRGIYDAMNKGADKATGDYIIFLNAGDIFASADTLKTIAENMGQSPDFIYGDALEGTHYKTARSHTKIRYGMFTHHQSMAYNRTTLGTLRHNTTYRIAGDYDLTLRFLAKNKSAVYIPTPLCIFEQGGISQQQVARGRNEQFLSRKNNCTCSALENNLIRLGQIVLWQIRTKAEPLYWTIRKAF